MKLSCDKGLIVLTKRAVAPLLPNLSSTNVAFFSSKPSYIQSILKMAEPFAIVACAVGIRAAFSTCVDYFVYMNLPRRTTLSPPPELAMYVQLPSYQLNGTMSLIGVDMLALRAQG